ncbi:transporter substrate-binding domain-containing protein [Fulvivirga sp. 29W222]|uniref:Transporter substrate-binding domain-containing protein n=1 Tax=Fulvivirga marina TaxID=2494733 RepID=A0A937KBY6_9BACT|nr:transporter substrate-binding domain-containing protein [Fulvivirga marina]MBL6447556.1 transporter substrate-binding domain-containing protein [Fulvivirga marina]
MNKYLKLCLALIVFQTIYLSCFGQLNGDSYAEAKAKGTANWVFTYSEAPGFAAKVNGKMTGVTFDLMNKFKEFVEQKENIRVNISYESSASDDFILFMKQVREGKGGVFGLTSTTITEERRRVYTFSPPYITNISMILSHNSVPTLANVADINKIFAGMTAVTVKNSTNEKVLANIRDKYYPSLKIEYVPSTRVAMQYVMRDPKKFTNADFTYYFEAIQNRQPVKRHPGGDIDTEQFGIIMPKNNDWAPLLEEFMSTEFLQSVLYKKIIADNLGQSAMKFFETIKR